MTVLFTYPVTCMFLSMYIDHTSSTNLKDLSTNTFSGVRRLGL